jgi:hypothetical protein
MRRCGVASRDGTNHGLVRSLCVPESRDYVRIGIEAGHIGTQAEELGLTLVEIDQTRSLEKRISLVEAHFEPFLVPGPLSMEVQ